MDKSQILRFSTCQYVDEGHHIILKGASDNGKTYISCALGNAACRRFKSVLYIRMPELLDELNIARDCGELQKLLKWYKKVDLLIVDEWLIRRLTSQESYDFLKNMEVRCGSTPNRPMILCTQYEPKGWYRKISPKRDSSISKARPHNAGAVWTQCRSLLSRLYKPILPLWHSARAGAFFPQACHSNRVYVALPGQYFRKTTL